MTPAIRTLPIVRAMRVARGWFVALPAGNLFAESEGQVRAMVARHAPGSVVMFLGQNPQRDAAEVAAVRRVRLSRSADGRSDVHPSQGAHIRREDTHRLTEGPESGSGLPGSARSPLGSRASESGPSPDRRASGRSRVPSRSVAVTVPSPARRASRGEGTPPASSPRSTRSAGLRTAGEAA